MTTSNELLDCDLNLEDDDGFKIACVRDGRDVRPGQLVRAGRGSFEAWCQVVYAEDGFCGLRSLTLDEAISLRASEAAFLADALTRGPAVALDEEGRLTRFYPDGRRELLLEDGC